MGNIVSFYYISLMKTFVLRILLALCRLTEDVCVENMFGFNDDLLKMFVLRICLVLCRLTEDVCSSIYF